MSSHSDTNDEDMNERAKEMNIPKRSLGSVKVEVSATSSLVFDETPPPPVTSRPAPRMNAWSISSTTSSSNACESPRGQQQQLNLNRNSPNNNNRHLDIQKGFTRSLTDIIQEEEKQREEEEALIELENLRIAELVQEEEMMRLAVERSITDMRQAASSTGSGSDHHNHNQNNSTSVDARNRAVQEQAEQTEAFTTRPIRPRALSSSQLQEPVSSIPLPSTFDRAQSWGSHNTTNTNTNTNNISRTLAGLPRPTLISMSMNNNNNNRTTRMNMMQRQQRPRPCLDNLPSVASGREAVLQVARRNLSLMDVELIERALEMGETSRKNNNNNACVPPSCITPVDRHGHGHGHAQQQQDDDEASMFDLDPVDPDSPTLEEEAPRDMDESTVTSMFDLDPDSPSRGPTLPQLRRSPVQLLSSPRLQASPSQKSHSSSSPRQYLPLRPPLTPSNSADHGHVGRGTAAASSNSSYFLEQAAQHVSPLELEEFKRALNASAAASRSGSEMAAAAPKINKVASYDLSGAENHLSKEELRQIQEALQDSFPACDDTHGDQKAQEESDRKPAPIHDNSISDDDAAAIVRALRDADEQEEFKSLHLAIQMQDEEENLQRQSVVLRRGQGNVRTITRAELNAERTSSPARLRHPSEEAEEIPLAAGFRMNAATSQEWARRDQNSVVGPNNEIRTKHDTELHGEANAQRLGLEPYGRESLRVGNQAYNSFRESVRRNSKGHTAQGSRPRSESDGDTKAERKESALKKN
jgi:hypothetical protein